MHRFPTFTPTWLLQVLLGMRILESTLAQVFGTCQPMKSSEMVCDHVVVHPSFENRFLKKKRSCKRVTATIVACVFSLFNGNQA